MKSYSNFIQIYQTVHIFSIYLLTYLINYHFFTIIFPEIYRNYINFGDTASFYAFRLCMVNKMLQNSCFLLDFFVQPSYTTVVI